MNYLLRREGGKIDPEKKGYVCFVLKVNVVINIIIIFQYIRNTLSKRQDFIYFGAVTQRHRRNTYINILLYTRDKMVDSKYNNHNINTYTNTYISIYYVIIQIFNTDILVSGYL